MALFAGQSYRIVRRQAGVLRERTIVWPTESTATLAGVYWDEDTLRLLVNDLYDSPEAVREVQAQAAVFDAEDRGHPIYLFENPPHLGRIVGYRAGVIAGIGTGYPPAIYMDIEIVRAANDPVQGIVGPVSTEAFRDVVAKEIYVVNSPGHQDSDGVIQAQLPQGWDVVPGATSSLDENATFLCTRISVQPSIADGTVSRVIDASANSYTVNLPAFPSRELVQGIVQGIEFNADTADRTMFIQGESYETVNATYLDRNRYDVLLERRRSS
ncbi:hypothetical protein [Candidatus Rariloculus sp.]|uniref:hypothetical protein n=1 Tax=Candidatus Rariloculus sp. TaxID=3101265 RepID=UPI003D0A961E